MKFQNNYIDEDGNPIIFYIGRLKKNPFRSVSKIYIWAFNEFFEERFLFIGVDDELGLTLAKAKKLAELLNQKAQKEMVPVNFDDWFEELNELEQYEIVQSSKKDNSKFK